MYLAILSENSKPFANNPTDSLIYGSTSENINLTESFHSIWEQAENYIQSTFNKIDHENEHPELFSIMAKAGLAAIRQGKSDDMVSHFDEIKNLKTPFFKKVYIGHEKRWNIIYHLVEEKDEIALNKIIEKLGKEIKNINSKLVDDFFEEDHHEQGEH
ncbi:MAG: hypothetical protein IPP37_14985 [Saprospiraceae bacterium]|nr:hypothetical protein [Saprospiraceae bacterium]